MLIRLDPAFLHLPTHGRLLEFLRHPFTQESCRHVDNELPAIASAYRALAAARVSWEGIEQPSLLNEPMVALMPVAQVNGTTLPLMPLELLQAQVVLLHEDLCDYQEHFGFSGDHNVCKGGSLGSAALALQAFSLHEAAVLTFAGLFTAQQRGSLVEFALTPLGEDCLRDRVCSATMQNFTDGSVRAAFEAAVAIAFAGYPLRRRSVAEAVLPAQLDALESRLLDTYLSLSSRMQADPTVVPLIARARQMCRWMAMLEMVRIAGEPVLQTDSAMLARLQLDPSVPDEILRERAKALSSDKGILRTPSGGFTLGDALLGHAVACCKGAVINGDVAKVLGEKFEEHVKSYVEVCVPASDYVVRDGIKASTKAKDAGVSYDCDLILFEPKRRKIFFVQVKWKRDGRTANLDDEMNEWRAKNSSLTHGVSQLKALRERLSERRVLDQIKGRLQGFGLTDASIAQNSNFIVVHTLPYFNAYMNDGVALYEWNFFRNLLLRGATQRAKAPIGQWGLLRPLPTLSHHETLPLENPKRAQDFFYESLGAELTEVPRLMESRLRARYGFDVKLGGKTWWRQLLASTSLRIVRPYL